MTPTILRGTARAACGATSPNLPIWRKSQVINHRVRRMKTPTSYDRLTMPARFSPKPWDLKVPHWWISYSAGHDELDSTVVEHRAYRRSVLRRGPLEWYLSGNPTCRELVGKCTLQTALYEWRVTRPQFRRIALPRARNFDSAALAKYLFSRLWLQPSHHLRTALHP
jgi:hypothetical protein